MGTWGGSRATVGCAPCTKRKLTRELPCAGPRALCCAGDRTDVCCVWFSDNVDVNGFCLQGELCF